MKLLYDGKSVGEIITNKNLTLEECFDLLDIDIDEMSDGDPVWDYDLFEMNYEG